MTAKGPRMSDPYRTVVRAVAEMTTQLKRVADTMVTAAADGQTAFALVPPTPVEHRTTTRTTRNTMSLHDHVNKQGDSKDAAREAIFEAIVEQANNLKDYADSRPAAEGLKNLAEAFAWLTNPGNAH